MKERDTELLLRDLNAKAPYGVKCKYNYGAAEGNIKLNYVDGNVARFNYGWHGNHHVIIDPKFIKPYIRPLSSMTDKEKKEFEDKFNSKLDIDEIHGTDVLPNYFEIGIELKSLDLISTWLDKKMFDWRRVYDEEEKKWKSMIDAGIAIKAPEGMYNF